MNSTPFLGDHVFQAGVLAVGAVAKVAVDRQHRLRHVHHPVRREETDDVRQTRVGGLVAVTAPHAAADREVVADEPVVLHDGDEAEAVGEHVQVVHRRNDEGDLEFARQIGLAVKRVHEVLVLRGFEIQLLRRRSRWSDTPGSAEPGPSPPCSSPGNTCSRACV